jgi:hypothetical protein
MDGSMCLAKSERIPSLFFCAPPLSSACKRRSESTTRVWNGEVKTVPLSFFLELPCGALSLPVPRAERQRARVRA